MMKCNRDLNEYCYLRVIQLLSVLEWIEKPGGMFFETTECIRSSPSHEIFIKNWILN